MFRAVLEYFCRIQPGYHGLDIKALPAFRLDGVSVRRQLRGKEYRIEIKRAGDGYALTVNDELLTGNHVPYDSVSGPDETVIQQARCRRVARRLSATSDPWLQRNDLLFPSEEAAGLPGWPGDIEKGSALDFSGLLDGPRETRAAGRRQRQFAFEDGPGKPVRFYGVNLSSRANFLDKPSCRRLADRLAACGYNSVRIHHHDGLLTQDTGERATA